MTLIIIALLVVIILQLRNLAAGPYVAPCERKHKQIAPVDVSRSAWEQ